MGIELALLCVAIAVGALICLRAAPIGRLLGVLDHPDNARKRHHRVTPQIGGVAIITGLLVWAVAANFTGLHADAPILRSVVFCGAGVALVGFSDDQNGITPLARLAFLALFTTGAFTLAPELVVPQIHSLIFPHGDIPLWVYYALVTIAAVGVVNAVNMADGQDGIAAGMFAIWTACLTYSTTGTCRSIAAVLLMLCLVFLVFNLKTRGKVFLGDCGSYGITFVIGLLVIYAHARGQIPIETIIVWFFIPVVDCLRLLISRSRRGSSPFRPDRDHFHHRLEDRLGKHWGLASYLASVGISSAISTLLPQWSVICLCVLSSFYFGMSVKREREIPVGVRHATDLRGNVVSISGDRGRGAA